MLIFALWESLGSVGEKKSLFVGEMTFFCRQILPGSLRIFLKVCVGKESSMRSTKIRMWRACLFAVALVWGVVAGYGQSDGCLRLVEWNVENLFDTLHTVERADTDFTPRGNHQWTSTRYWGKLGRVSRILAALGGERPADLVALAEVENDSVLYDLTRRTRLARLGYNYVATNSPDVRGMNVALLYQPHRFRPVGADTLRFLPPSPKTRPTRDALHVAGELITGDTLDFIVCHWPSRRDGASARHFRESIGRRLRAFCDSLFSVRCHPALVLTGDFNAWPPETALSRSLGAELPGDSVRAHSLYIMSHGLQASRGIRGTYKYRGEWNQLDHFIVSGTLLLKEGRDETLHTSSADCRIGDFPFLLKDEKEGGGVRPRRTYLGTFYQGGCSDHLPLVLDLHYAIP